MAGPADLELVRDWVGDLPDNDTIYQTLDRYGGSVDLAALAILRRRRTELASSVSEVSEFAVAGDASWKTGSTSAQQFGAVKDLIASLEKKIADDAAPAGDVLPTVTTGRLVRPGTMRDRWWCG